MTRSLIIAAANDRRPDRAVPHQEERYGDDGRIPECSFAACNALGDGVLRLGAESAVGRSAMRSDLAAARRSTPRLLRGQGLRHPLYGRTVSWWVTTLSRPF